MLPMSKKPSGTHAGERFSGAPPHKKELRDSEEGTEHSIAPVLTEEQETKLWRRIDLRLIPIITLMYLFCSIDKANIGNAVLDGLMAQLNLTGDKFNIALMMFFVPYSLLEFPSNLVIQVIRPSRWVPGIVVLWGLIMMLMGFVKTYPQLVGVRVCLGAAEAGLYPGVAYYLTMWYPKYMYQYRVGLFTAGVGLAGAFSGLLAYVIGFMGGKGGLLGWSWIFILEGVATILVGLLAAWVMVDYPSTAKFLTPEERSFIIEKRGHDDDAHDDEQDMSQQVWAAFTDWQVWALAIVQASIAIPGYAISFFLPSIIFGFGYSIPVTQLLTVPAYVVSAAMVLVFGYFSDELKLRSPFVFAGQSVSMLGYIINITDAPSGVKFFGAYLCIIGTFACSPGPISWLANNLRGKYKRAVGIALQISVSTLGGLIGSNIFRAQDAPRYLLGHGLAIMFIGTGLVTVVVTVLVYKHMNARLDREELVEKQQGRKVDPAPGFRYTL